MTASTRRWVAPSSTTSPSLVNTERMCAITVRSDTNSVAAMEGLFRVAVDGLQLAAIYQHEVDRYQLLVLELPKRPRAVVSPSLPGVAARA